MFVDVGVTSAAVVKWPVTGHREQICVGGGSRVVESCCWV